MRVASMSSIKRGKYARVVRTESGDWSVDRKALRSSQPAARDRLGAGGVKRRCVGGGDRGASRVYRAVDDQEPAALEAVQHVKQVGGISWQPAVIVPVVEQRSPKVRNEGVEGTTGAPPVSRAPVSRCLFAGVEAGDAFQYHCLDGRLLLGDEACQKRQRVALPLLRPRRCRPLAVGDGVAAA